MGEEGEGREAVTCVAVGREEEVVVVCVRVCEGEDKHKVLTSVRIT